MTIEQPYRYCSTANIGLYESGCVRVCTISNIGAWIFGISGREIYPTVEMSHPGFGTPKSFSRSIRITP